MAKAMRQRDRTVSQPIKKTRARLKKERPMPKQNPAQGEKQDAKNEDPVTHPRHKRLRMNGRMGSKDQISP